MEKSISELKAEAEWNEARVMVQSEFIGVEERGDRSVIFRMARVGMVMSPHPDAGTWSFVLSDRWGTITLQSASS